LCTAAYSEDAEMVEYLPSKGADEWKLRFLEFLEMKTQHSVLWSRMQKNLHKI
jgi:hypothetical protein